MIGVLVLAALGFATFDIWWFTRIVYLRIISKFRKSLKVTDEAIIKSICWTNDLDFFGHMNNSKYLRELDFARLDYYHRTGFTDLIQSIPGAFVVQHASTIRYRKSIEFLMPFKIVTKLLYFDERSLYFEQKFISYPDNFVRAVAICKNTAVKVDIPKAMEKFGLGQPLACPPEVQKFIECHEISSNKMRMKGIPGTVSSDLSAMDGASSK